MKKKERKIEEQKYLKCKILNAYIMNRILKAQLN